MSAARAARRTTLRALTAAVFAALTLTGTAGAASTDPQVQIAAADQSWATSMLLNSSDLGRGWAAVSAWSDPSSGSGHSSCPVPDESDLTVTGSGSSPDFIRGNNGWAASTARVWQSSAQAQADWDRTVQSNLLTCTAADFQAASTKKVKVVVAGKRELDFAGVAPRAAAYRISLAYKFTVKRGNRPKKMSVPATFDFVFLGNGRASVVFATLSLKTRPPAQASIQSLAQKLAQRMASDPTPAP